MAVECYAIKKKYTLIEKRKKKQGKEIVASYEHVCVSKPIELRTSPMASASSLQHRPPRQRNTLAALVRVAYDQRVAALRLGGRVGDPAERRAAPSTPLEYGELRANSSMAARFPARVGEATGERARWGERSHGPRMAGGSCGEPAVAGRAPSGVGEVDGRLRSVMESGSECCCCAAVVSVVRTVCGERAVGEEPHLSAAAAGLAASGEPRIASAAATACAEAEACRCRSDDGEDEDEFIGRPSRP